ncbi:Scm-like with four MBT domains protein 2 [Hypsibius exemplaris]|uniref:Scm-like with four MBT domains protein 2 n=1 Tax=Hypsibius exemplaris TaxID=2072580 RepID=A0A1W0X0Y4_HYPEX|nr:Scm-like with four MBT domains protein 2 [Hypsibius exemplaris]
MDGDTIQIFRKEIVSNQSIYQWAHRCELQRRLRAVRIAPAKPAAKLELQQDPTSGSSSSHQALYGDWYPLPIRDNPYRTGDAPPPTGPPAWHNEPYETCEGQWDFYNNLHRRRGEIKDAWELAEAEKRVQQAEREEGRRESSPSHVTTLVPALDNRIGHNPDNAEEVTGASPQGPPAVLPPLPPDEMPALDSMKMELQRAEMEFSWELYLQEMNAHPVPHLAFDHVRKSLENGLEEGQFLEYIYPTESGKKTYWYLELLHARGPEVFVRYFGLEECPLESFWLDLRTADVYSFGSIEKKHPCRPPKVVVQHRKYFGDLNERIKKGLPSPNREALSGHGVALKDRFEVGRWLEVIDDEQPASVWPAVVDKNIGGRLLLKFRKPKKRSLAASEGSSREQSEDSEASGLWIFCTNPRLQAMGRGLKPGFTYAPPKGLELSEKDVNETKDLVQEFLSSSQNPTDIVAVADVFQPFIPSNSHFQKGYCVEFLHPVNRQQICPALITDVFPDGTMAVEVLDFRPEGKKEKIVKICRINSLEVLPVQWGAKNGVRVRAPGMSGDFDWKSYITEHGGSLAPEKWFPHLLPLKNPTFLNRFQRGMKLEVSNPAEPDELCTATVVKIITPLLWVHIDSYGQSSTHCLTFTSTEMFPIGFCGSNDYALKLPRLMTHGRRMATLRGRSQPSPASSPAKSPRSQDSTGESTPTKTPKEKEKTSPPPTLPVAQDFVKVYINPQCNVGPLMNLKKVTNLPRWIGPGPVQGVLDSVITSLISCGSKQAKMLSMVNATGDGPKSVNWERVKIKAKIGGRRQMGQIDVVKNASQVPAFLRNICIQYEACPNLLTTEPVTGDCPETCDQFIKPEPKTVIIRRPLKVAQLMEQKMPGAEEASPLDGSMISEAEIANKEPQSAHTSQADSDEDADMGMPMSLKETVAMDEDADTLPGSLATSRNASPETEIPALLRNGVNGKTRGRSLEEDNGEDQPAKKLKRIPGATTFYVSKPKYLTSPPTAQEPETPSESSSESEDSDESAEYPGPQPASRKAMASASRSFYKGNDSENLPAVPENRLVDDSEYLLHFYKNPDAWTVDDVHKFLKRHLPSSRAPDVLRREGVDGDVLMMMCASDMRYIKLEDHDAIFVANLIERILFSVLITKGQRIPLYANWK